MTSRNYPVNADIHRRKAEGRAALSQRTFGEKIAAMEALRARLAPLKAARGQRFTRAGPEPSKLDVT